MRTKRGLLPLVLAGLSFVAACGSSSSAPEAKPGNPDEVKFYAQRYCEVLVVKATPAGPVADVWNTFPLNTCPEKKWKKIDAAAIATSEQAIVAMPNGPRYWLMDSVEKTDLAKRTTQSFAGMKMNRYATVHLTSLKTDPYVVHEVDRKTVFSFDKGRRIYELTDEKGQHWVMQSWSQQIDPTLELKDLAGIADTLHLPAGWSYSSRVLASPLRVVTTSTTAKVLQDDLKNSYSLETAS